LVASLYTNTISRLNVDGSLDASVGIWNGTPMRDWGNNGINTIEVQTDCKIILAGGKITFNWIDSNYIIRLNSDLTKDTSFTVGNGFDSVINTIAVQGDGKILVGGLFSNYQWTSTKSIVRLNADWSKDTSFTIYNDFDSNVNAIEVQWNDKILLGGGGFKWLWTYTNYIVRV
jgi:uncharacterized delta-60 repeat protein